MLENLGNDSSFSSPKDISQPDGSSTKIWYTRTQEKRTMTRLIGPSNQSHHSIGTWLLYPNLNSSPMLFLHHLYFPNLSKTYQRPL